MEENEALVGMVCGDCGVWASGCGGKASDLGLDTGEIDPSEIDLDGDGSMSDVDCDDADATVYPGADEICDDLDNNCDGQVDETLFEMFLDSDSDGFGDPNASVEDCNAGRLRGE